MTHTPFDPKNLSHVGAMRALPFSYFSLPLYLAGHASVFERNGETIIAVPNQEEPNDLQALFVPRMPSNQRDVSIRFATADERDAIAAHSDILYEQQTVTEFFYRTEDFANPTGDLAKKIRAFVAHNQFAVLDRYPKELIAGFYREWESQRGRGYYHGH